MIKNGNLAEELNIETIGDLKELLNKFDDNVSINFGTDSLGFGIGTFEFDSISLSLLSEDLAEYLAENDYS